MVEVTLIRQGDLYETWGKPLLSSFSLSVTRRFWSLWLAGPTLDYRVAKSRPSASGSWDLKSEKWSMTFNGKIKLFSGPVWIVPWISHMLCVIFKDNFPHKEHYNLPRRCLVMLGFVWVRFVNYSSPLPTRIIYVIARAWNCTSTDMAISLLHFTAFFQGQDKSIDRGENHYKSGHVESFSYRYERRREEEGKNDDMTSHTRRTVVFLIVFSQRHLTE